MLKNGKEEMKCAIKNGVTSRLNKAEREEAHMQLNYISLSSYFQVWSEVYVH